MTTVKSPQAVYNGLLVTSGLAFLGVPYARPPTGPLRFAPPEALARGGTVDATAYDAAPPQMKGSRTDWMPPAPPDLYGENCLNLNLWTPASDGACRPVIVHVFGGGFQGGSANGGHIDGPAFASHNDVVLVRPNMRTGVLGFLHLAEHFPQLAETNRGMLDLVAALHWVRDNVASFGGDPKNVTLVGLSSGAFTVASLLGNPVADGLLHRAWMMSGSASRIVLPDTAAAITADFLHRTGVRVGDIDALVALPVERILSVQGQVLASDLGERNAPHGRTLGIVLDGRSLPRHPLDAIVVGAAASVPVILGYTRNEARMWYATGVMGVADEARLRQTIARFDGAQTDATLSALKDHFFGASASRLEEEFLSARIYKDPALRTAAAQRAAGGRAWTYEFSWSPSGRFEHLGAAHGFDEPFVFGHHRKSGFPIMEECRNVEPLAGSMETALSQFARTGHLDAPDHMIF